MRRARLQVKPILNSRLIRPTSDNNVESKEDGSHPKPAEEGTSGSVPAAVETNSSTSSTPKLNFRRPAFSVRPKPTIRGLGVPNLHGSQSAPIVLSSSSKAEENVVSGDAAESAILKKPEDPVSVPVPFDVKEDSATTLEKEVLVEAESGNTEKDISKDKETPSSIQRRSKFQIRPKIQSKPSLPPTDLQPPEPNIKGKVSAAPEKASKEIQENKPSLCSNATIKTSKSIPITKSQFLSCPELGTKTTKSPAAAESPANQESDTSVLLPVVDIETAAGKEKQYNTKDVSKPSTSTLENSEKARLQQKPEETTTVKTNQPSDKILSNDKIKSVNASDEVKTVKQNNDTQSDNSTSNEINPTPVRRSRFSVQPKLSVKTPIGKLAIPSQPVNNEESLIQTKTVENITEEGAKGTISKEEAVNNGSSKNESETTVLPRRKRFQIQPRPSVKKTEQAADFPKTIAENVLASQSETTDESASKCISADAECGREKGDSEDAVTNKDGDDAASKETTSKVETSLLSRRSRFRIQPKPRTKTVDQTSGSSSSKQAAAVSLPTIQPVTPKTDVSASPKDAVTSKTNDNKQKYVSKGEDNEKDIDANSRGTDRKIETAILPRRSRFQAQPKLRAKTTLKSSTSSSEPSLMTLATDQPVTGNENLSAEMIDVNDIKQKNDSGNNNDDQNAAVSKEMATKIKTTLSKDSHIKIQPKSNAKTANQSSTSTPKQTVSNLPESETSSVSTEATSTLEPDGVKQKDNSEIKITDKDADAVTDKETTAKEAPVPTLSRRMRFHIRPKLGASQPKDESPSAPVEVKTTDEALKTPKETTSVAESSILPRRNRFQIQPKPSAKTTKQSSSSLPKVTTAEMSHRPLISDNDTAVTCSGDTTLETDDNKRKEESENEVANKDTDDATKELPSEREQTPLPTLSRRSRFQIQPKIGVTQSKDNQPSASGNEENAKTTSTENTSKRRNRFQIQLRPNAKTAEQSSAMAASKKTESNQSETNDIPSTSVEAVTSEVDSKTSNDPENKDGNIASKDATSKMEKTAVPTLSRRSRFQVRPKLGISKEVLKSLGKPTEAKEKRAEKKSPPKSTILPVAVLSTSKDAKRNKEGRQSVSPQATTEDDLLNSESRKLPEKSFSDSRVPTTPVKFTGKNSASSPLKDNIQIENIKQREYPVNVHKSGKSGKSLPLREKQKKPDVSVHPSDKPPDRAKMKMRDLIYWNPSSSPMKSPDAKRARPIRLTEESAPKAPEPTTNENEPIAVPQVKIGADGNIVLNEESLVINNSQPTAPISLEVVDETDVYSNYGSFRKYTPKSKWSLKETKKFFLALSTVGTDFSLMTNLFTKKTRRDLKNKFKREERNNRWLVDKAIKQQLQFDEKLFEELSESEEEEEEPPAKKSRQKKESSESQKKKDNKSGKSKKTPKSDTSSPIRKARKSKKISNKEWIIGSQDDEEEEEPEDIVEEIVEEEPVHDEMLIVPENVPFCDDALTS